MSSLLLVAILWAQQIAYAEAVSCYTPNGDDRNAQFNVSNLYIYAPCNTTAAYSMCCAVGPGRQGTADICRPDGLCLSTTNDIWRESCTDPTWQAPECLKLFVNGTGFENTTIIFDGSAPTNDVTVRRCDNGSFCYGTGNGACCAQGQGVWLDSQGQQVSVNPNATTTSGTAAATSAAPTSSPSATSTPTSSGEGGLSTGAKAGIGVGIGGTALVLAVILSYWLYGRRRNRRTANNEKPTKSDEGYLAQEVDSLPKYPTPELEHPQQHPQELDTPDSAWKGNKIPVHAVEIAPSCVEILNCKLHSGQGEDYYCKILETEAYRTKTKKGLSGPQMSHFAVVDGEKAGFYRNPPIASYTLNPKETQGQKRMYDFVREIYNTFYPARLKRICDALAAIKHPRTLSMTSHMSVEESESQEQDPSARSLSGKCMTNKSH